MISPHETQTSSDQAPILIAGLGRSGTTWTGKIFDSHPGVLYRNEPDREPRIKQLSVADSAGTDEFQQRFFDFLKQVPFTRQPNTIGILPIFRKQYETLLEFLVRRHLTLLLRSAGKVVGDVSLPHFLTSARIARQRLVWKSVSCVRDLGFISRAYPELHILFVVRHPCGMIASRVRGEARGDFKSIRDGKGTYRRLERLLDSPCGADIDLSNRSLQELTSIERHAVRWAVDNQKAMSDLDGMPNCHVLRYEDLCNDPLGVTRSLFDKLHLDWNRQTEQFVLSSTSAHHSRYYSLVKNPQQAANAWRDELSAPDQQRILRITRNSRPGKLFWCEDAAPATV